MIKITKNTVLSEILKYPKAKEILAEYNVPCLFCPLAKFEMENLSIKDITERYNINLKDLLESLNNSIS